jgi:hypothetical protein
LAVEAVVRATGEPASRVAEFLGGMPGQLLAEEVVARMRRGSVMAEALDVVTTEWMRQRVDRVLAMALGLPQGEPYLRSLVRMYSATPLACSDD